jgi:Protein of unknown function (DUF2924)
MSRLDDQLAGLETMAPARLRAEWRRLHRGQHFPEGLTASQLIRAIAWRLQEKTHRGLPPERARQLDRMVKQLEADGEIELAAPQSLKTGTQLVRHWHGKVHCVTVLDDGFEFETQRYSSLTQIARHITGAAWSGPRFFGLRNRRGETR